MSFCGGFKWCKNHRDIIAGKDRCLIVGGSAMGQRMGWRGHCDRWRPAAGVGVASAIGFGCVGAGCAGWRDQVPARRMRVRRRWPGRCWRGFAQSRAAISLRQPSSTQRKWREFRRGRRGGESTGAGSAGAAGRPSPAMHLIIRQARSLSEKGVISGSAGAGARRARLAYRLNQSDR